MPASVRDQLLSTLYGRLAALGSSGSLVLEPGDDDSKIAAALAAGKAVFEPVPGNDEHDDPMSTAEQFEFFVIVAVHIPESLIASAGSGGGGVRSAAHQLCELVYSTYGPELQEPMGGFALSARCTMFCGGPYIGETRHCLHEVRFKYRFLRGDPQQGI